MASNRPRPPTDARFRLGFSSFANPEEALSSVLGDMGTDWECGGKDELTEVDYNKFSLSCIFTYRVTMEPHMTQSSDGALTFSSLRTRTPGRESQRHAPACDHPIRYKAPS